MRSQAEIGKYAAQIVHNLRTPLHALSGALDLVELMSQCDKTIDANELDDIIQLARRSLLDLRQIVAGILDHARVEGAFLLEKVDLNAIIEQELIFFDLDPVFRKSIKRQIELTENLPAFLGNATHLKQVLDNLIRNAMDAMADSPNKHIRIATKNDDSSVYFEVGDTGKGIAADDLPHIFSGEFTTKANGNGIGLSSVKRIVSAYGGSVEVKSQAGSGSVFTVRLPIQKKTHLEHSLVQISI
jgi:signal transduction histidine kinase